MLSSIRPTVTIGDAGGEVEGLSVPVSIMSFNWLLSHSTFFSAVLGWGCFCATGGSLTSKGPEILWLPKGAVQEI